MHNVIPHMMTIPETNNISDKAIIKGNGRIYIGLYVTIEENVVIDSGDSPESIIEISDRSKIKCGAILRAYGGNIKIGSRTSVGEYTVIAGHGGVLIGDAVIIAGHCYISAADHIVDSPEHIRFLGETARGINIGSGSWLGARSVVLDGIDIGRNSVVGAGSVVTRNIGHDAICYGVPCREVRKRILNEFNNF